ncbi:MAG TPA: 50S ribosomal protein L25, partial [Ilumatobacteraceae bacterium]|nr:50S ribosomal protein L25 [Ilumatobacteraceae bacterium]
LSLDDPNDEAVALSGAAGFNTVLSLEVDGTRYPAIIKEVQRHPVKRTVAHIDFMQVDMKEVITFSVPLRLTGEAKAVTAHNGLVDPAVDSIEVECTPGNLPTEFEIDITDMQPGDVIRLADLTAPAGVTILGDPDTTVVTALHGVSAADLETDGGEAAAEGEAGSDAAE